MRPRLAPPHALAVLALVACSSNTPAGDGGATHIGGGEGGGGGSVAAAGVSGSSGAPAAGGSGGGGAGGAAAGGRAAGGVAGTTSAGGPSMTGGSAGSAVAAGGTAAGGRGELGGMGGMPAGSGGAAGTELGGRGGSAAGSAGSPGGAGGNGGLRGGASGKFVCTPGASYGNPLAGMGSVTSIGPPTMGQPNYFAFVEGPVWIASLGRLFFSDNVSPERIWSVTPGGIPSVFQEMSNSNGLALDSDDRIIVTDQEMNRITRLDPTSNHPMQVLITAAGCKPNDVIVRSDGNIYYTAPQQAGTGFYRIDPSGTVTGPRTDVGAPNGIVLTPDEMTLYVGDVNNKQITRFALDAGGAIAATGTLFATAMNTTVDGMCVDCAGDLYAATSNGVEVYAPDGSYLGIVPTGEASNCTFGGADRKTLFATSRSQLKSVTLGVPGLPD